MYNIVKPHAWVALRLPSDTLKVLQIVPKSIVSLGKYGTFSSNAVLGRPLNVTYELIDKLPGQRSSDLRIVPAAELHAEALAEELSAESTEEGRENGDLGNEPSQRNVDEAEELLANTIQSTLDDPARQTLTMEEIEELKRQGTGAGKELIAKLLLSHTALNEKTAFSLAKYKLVKARKYLRRFTILPLDVPMLTQWMLEEKDVSKIFEIREEMLALIGCLSDVHFSPQMDQSAMSTSDDGSSPKMARRGGRYLIVDDLGGLLVAAMAERMGILHAPSCEDDSHEQHQAVASKVRSAPTWANSNTITLLHNNQQPNLALLKYFSFSVDNPPEQHPLASHLLSISWLQLISPHLDTAYSAEVPSLSAEQLYELKGNKRTTYFRKQRRRARARHIVEDTWSGDFSGLVIASSMDLVSILRHTVPLLRGGASITVYCPTIEPLLVLSDLYSTARRTAFQQAPPESYLALDIEDRHTWKGDDDFPLHPTLLINATIHSTLARSWQVLPGRTHPKMMGRGGAMGFAWTALRVIPSDGHVAARGVYMRRRKDVGQRSEEVSGVADPTLLSSQAALPLNEEAPSEERNGSAKRLKLDGDR